MTDRRDAIDDPARPSQAEGDRATIEQALGEQPDRRVSTAIRARATTRQASPARPRASATLPSRR